MVFDAVPVNEQEAESGILDLSSKKAISCSVLGQDGLKDFLERRV